MSEQNTPSPVLDADSNMLQAQLSSDVSRRRASSPRMFASDARNLIVEKELMESQMRKIQMENSTLQTENKLLKDKYNRATARISELDSRVNSLEDELEEAQDCKETEVSRATRQVRAELERELEKRQARITALTRDSDKLQNEIKYLQQNLESITKEMESLRNSFDLSKTVEAQKMENHALKTEAAKLQELLSQSEAQLEEMCQQNVSLSQQLCQVVELKELLQLQLDTGGMAGTTAEKRVISLEQRLRVTEERLTQERADRANNLSQVEDKLLTENSKLQASEKGLTRQLQREKDKNRTLEQRFHDYREENMKLRLALPDEDHSVLTHKMYDIPNSHRQRTKKENNVKAVLEALKDETDIGEGEDAAIIWLWNQRKSLLNQLHEWNVYLNDFHLAHQDAGEGLKMLREKLTEYEKKFKELEEKMDDVQAEKVTVESTYKQQLSILVKERHESFARLKTLEDLMDALRKENELLRHGLLTNPEPDNKLAAATEAQLDSLKQEVQASEAKLSQFNRRSKALEMEVETLRAQVSARDIALEEAHAEIKTVLSKQSQSEESALLKERVSSLLNELSEMKEDFNASQLKAESLQREKLHLEGETEELERQLRAVRSRQTKQAAAREGGKESQITILAAELEQKDMQLVTLTAQLRQLEEELDTTQRQLLLHRENALALQAQVEEHEAELQNRGELLDAVREKRSSLLDQLSLAKAQFDAATLSLSQRQSQIQILQMELHHEKERAAMLEQQVNVLRRGRSDEMFSTEGQPEVMQELWMQELDEEILRLRGDLTTTTNQLGSLQQEKEVETQESRKVKEELVNAQMETSLLSTRVAILEQELEVLSQDHKCVTEEHQQAENHLVMMESRLQEVLHKFELDARRQHGDFVIQYTQLTPDDGPLILAELNALRLLTGEKNKEVDMLINKISRQQTEAKNLEKKLQTLKSVQSRSKDDINRVTAELVLKIKENTATSDMNQTLVKGQNSLQKEIQRLQQIIDDERAQKGKRKVQIEEVIKKVEKNEVSQKEVSNIVQKKDSLIAELEAEIRQVKRTLSQMEVENEQLKAKIDHLNEDIRNLGSVNSTLEKRLEMERASLAEERTNASKRREDLANANLKFEELKHEQTMLVSNLNAEQKNNQKLKEDIQRREKMMAELEVQIQSLKMETETQHGQLLACRTQIENLKQDKDVVYKDYQDVCRQLGEKDHLLREQQRQSENDVEAARLEINRLLASQDMERGQLELEITKIRDELNTKKDKLQQKELQLAAFGRTLQELEDTVREKKDLEMKLARMESLSDEQQLLVESLRHELSSAKNSSAHLQEAFGKSQVGEVMLQDQLRSVKDMADSQAMELRHMMEGMKAHHEFERKSLREALQQLETNLKLTEADLRAALEKQEDIAEDKRVIQLELEALKTQSKEETAAHKMTQEKLELLKSQLNDAKRSKYTSEEKFLGLQSTVAKLESDLAAEREKTRAAAYELQEMEGAVEAKGAVLKGKNEQMEVLRAEVAKLQQILESQKHQLALRLRKSTSDLKQQVDSTETERLKLAQQAQQMSVELEQVREHLALKVKENIKLQEQIVSLEDLVREHSSKLQIAQATLHHEEELQSKLNARFQEQEDELCKLRAFLSGKAAEEGDGKSMWKEVNRVMQDLSQKLLKQMEEVRVGGREGHDARHTARLKKELRALESQLNTEKALHTITKNALQNSEEDCTRLRQQLYHSRRRGHSQDRKQKSRMEEINDIIARSQTRAQALLSSGAYLDGTFRHLNPSRDFNLTAPRASTEASPDSSIALSDTSFTSAGGGFYNNSFLNMSATFSPGTPRK